MIFHRYLALGGEAGFLGLPRATRRPCPAGARATSKAVRFSGHPDRGARGPRSDPAALPGIRATSSFLKYPISDEEKVFDHAGQDSGGRLSRFQGGTIYWSAGSGRSKCMVPFETL